ncbi:hypothetical protein Daus18300_012337 [Diaporthe australafricana]|uniref:Uncharacterized protein n=1 Tax=Diaporthe australafricana TaxID=127596 RepID=A0ABR3W3A5_9PEZI
MAPQLGDMHHTGEEQDDNWEWVEKEGTYSVERRPQLKECNISPAQKSTSIVDGDALSDLASKPLHTKRFPHAIDVGLHGVKGTKTNPTTIPQAESADSTATGLTFSALEDVSSDPQLHTPAEDSKPQPLTWANLGPNHTPALVNNIQAWIDGDLSWLRVAVGDDQASVVPFERVTTCHSSDGSLDFVFVPALPSRVGRDVQEIGTKFEHLPYTTTYSQRVELDDE